MTKVVQNCFVLIPVMAVLFGWSAASLFNEQSNEGDVGMDAEETFDLREPQQSLPSDDSKRNAETPYPEPFQNKAHPWVRSQLTQARQKAGENHGDEELDVRRSSYDQLSAKDELFDSEAIQEPRDVKSETDEKVKMLESTVSDLKTAVATMSQQIDALLRQDSETLKLLNVRTSSVGQRNWFLEKRATPKRGVGVQVTTTGGVSYIRWGRTTCNSSGTQLLYKGFSATSHYSNLGGGSNFLCLHEQPEWGVHISGFGDSSRIYGAQYSLHPQNSPFSTANNQNLNLINNDAPCAVCHNPLRSNKVMIPARRSCPLGWTVEYRGYVVSTYYHYKDFYRSSYICLDEAPETIPGGQTFTNGARLYPVEANCGSLPCPKYVDGYEIACVVCSK